MIDRLGRFMLVREIIPAHQARPGDIVEVGELTRYIREVQPGARGTTLVFRDGCIALAHGVRITVHRGGCSAW